MGRLSLGGKCAPHPHARGRWEKQLYLQEPGGKSKPRPSKQFLERRGPGGRPSRAPLRLCLRCQVRVLRRERHPWHQNPLRRLQVQVRCTPAPCPAFLPLPCRPLRNRETPALTWEVCRVRVVHAEQADGAAHPGRPSTGVLALGRSCPPGGHGATLGDIGVVVTQTAGATGVCRPESSEWLNVLPCPGQSDPREASRPKCREPQASGFTISVAISSKNRILPDILVWILSRSPRQP